MDQADCATQVLAPGLRSMARSGVGRCGDDDNQKRYTFNSGAPWQEIGGVERGDYGARRVPGNS